jgi:hypothetical protein
MLFENRCSWSFRGVIRNEEQHDITKPLLANWFSLALIFVTDNQQELHLGGVGYGTTVELKFCASCSYRSVFGTKLLFFFLKNIRRADKFNEGNPLDCNIA